MATSIYDVCAIGNAILEVALDVTDEFLAEYNIAKGETTVVDFARIGELRRFFNSARSSWAGAGAVNVLGGFTSFGGTAAYIGKIANDEAGQVFQKEIRRMGIRYTTPMADTGLTPATGTGIRLTFITPDKQKTACVFPGAGAELGPEDLDLDAIRTSQITYLEGGMIDYPASKAALFLAADKASRARARVAFAIGNLETIERHRAEYLQLVKSKVDIFFGNVKEVLSLYQVTLPMDAVRQLRNHVNTGIITRAEKGAAILNITHRQIDVVAEPVIEIVDKTGAGDMFAAGFLYGIARQFDLIGCGNLGALAAHEALSHPGPRPSHKLSTLGKEKGLLRN